jgi:ribosomal-protein-serine acetyltransferase
MRVAAHGSAIEIRLLEEKHAEELFQLIEANRASLRQWLPWLDWSNSPADTAEHIRPSQSLYRESNGFAAGIWIDNQLAGSIGLHTIDSRHRSSSIGYWLSEQFRGRGAMTRACWAVVNTGFEYYRLHRIEIRCATGNQKSCAVARRLGFIYEGTLREAEWLYDHFVDLAVYSMLEQDWSRLAGSDLTGSQQPGPPPA